MNENIYIYIVLILNLNNHVVLYTVGRADLHVNSSFIYVII